MHLPDGFVAVVKRSCPTCELVAPVLSQIPAAGVNMTVYCQDHASWPPGLPVRDDTSLEVSFHLNVETVPALLQIRDGEVLNRLEGWSRAAWEEATGVSGLGAGLPDYRPGCGSRTLDPDVVAARATAAATGGLASRRVEIGALEDEMEALFDRGWTDGLPVVPPTPERVARMLEGTRRDPDEIVAVVPPDLVECTVEKVAVNAVMAGCRPEYLPVVLTCVEAACTDEFNMHGLLCTTWFSGPVVIVNGPVAKSIGMNSGVNVFGQGTRANATIGRALQLVVRNVGGGRPGEIDRATFGHPGKVGFCFAEDEDRSPWEPLSVERGHDPGVSTVTLFAGEGPRGIVDQLSRTPESLARSFAACLRTVAHPKLALVWDAILAVSPEHARVFREAGWSKAQLREELYALLTTPGAGLAHGADGIAEGLPDRFAGASIPKFRPGGLIIVHCGGTAGLFSAIIGGWASGPTGSQHVTWEVGT